MPITRKQSECIREVDPEGMGAEREGNGRAEVEHRHDLALGKNAAFDAPQHGSDTF